MAVLTAGSSITLTLTDYNSVTVSTRGLAVANAVSGLGVAAGKLAEVTGMRTLGPYLAGQISITATSGDCQYEVGAGQRPTGHIILGSSAPSNSDGRADGTIYIQTA